MRIISCSHIHILPFYFKRVLLTTQDPPPSPPPPHTHTLRHYTADTLTRTDPADTPALVAQSATQLCDTHVTNST